MKLNNLVKNIIENNKINNQTEIKDILFNKYKIKITQSNISRILKQINAIKVIDDDKKTYYEIKDKLNKNSDWLKNLVKKIDDNGNIILVTSYSGSGNIIGQFIDENNIDGIMGTVSGDNTTIIIPKDIKKIKEIRLNIEKILL